MERWRERRCQNGESFYTYIRYSFYDYFIGNLRFKDRKIQSKEMNKFMEIYICKFML